MSERLRGRGIGGAAEQASQEALLCRIEHSESCCGRLGLTRVNPGRRVLCTALVGAIGGSRRGPFAPGRCVDQNTERRSTRLGMIPEGRRNDTGGGERYRSMLQEARCRWVDRGGRGRREGHWCVPRRSAPRGESRPSLGDILLVTLP